MVSNINSSTQRRLAILAIVDVDYLLLPCIILPYERR
jgi:hypothetical protein